MTTVGIRTAILTAQFARTAMHDISKDFNPIIEADRNGEMIGVVVPSPWANDHQKIAGFTEVAVGLRAMGVDTIRFVTDAHVRKFDLSDMPEDVDDILPPSQDPRSVDSMIVFEWKDGEPTGAATMEYHILDDGRLDWGEARYLDAETTKQSNSWMHEAIESTWKQTKPREGMDLHEMTKAWLKNKGHLFVDTPEDLR